jgi:hypothetical protein
VSQRASSSLPTERAAILIDDVQALLRNNSGLDAKVIWVTPDLLGQKPVVEIESREYTDWILAKSLLSRRGFRVRPHSESFDLAKPRQHDVGVGRFCSP